MKYVVSSFQEFKDFLSYFSGFHDATINSIALKSHYETSANDGKVKFLPGFDVTIEFSHYGYADLVPFDRLITIDFLDGKDFFLDVPVINDLEFLVLEAEVTKAEDDWLLFSISTRNTVHPEKQRLDLVKFRRAIIYEE